MFNVCDAEIITTKVLFYILGYHTPNKSANFLSPIPSPPLKEHKSPQIDVKLKEI